MMLECQFQGCQNVSCCLMEEEVAEARAVKDEGMWKSPEIEAAY